MMLEEMQHESGRFCLSERMILCSNGAYVITADVTDGETLRG